MVDFTLNDAEARVMGALFEKSMATPDYYPLSLNALTNACNQKSNRDPVVSFEEATVVRALDGLKEKRLVVQSSASRVPKYEECMARNSKLVDRETSLICLLILRGPQTIGELRGRSERLYSFGSLEEVEETLQSLDEMDLVVKLPRQPGRKESRFAHLLSGDPLESLVRIQAQPEVATMQVRAENERLAELEKEVAGLKEKIDGLAQVFDDFKAQFE